MRNVQGLIQYLSTASRSIVLVPHYRPDADALGACVALQLYLEKKGHSTQVIAPSDYPTYLRWIRGTKDILIFEQAEDKARRHIEEADIVFIVDSSSPNRLGGMRELIAKSGAKKAIIDHHPVASMNIADYAIWSEAAAASAELVYHFISLCHDESLIDKNIAEYLYAGIMTDTGNFNYSVSSHLYHVVGHLMAKNVEVEKINGLVYGSYSEERTRFIGHALTQCMKVYAHCHTAVFILQKIDLSNYNLQVGDTEGLVNYALSIKGIICSILLKEQPDIIKISLRSVGDFSVNTLAAKYFNGGGHKKAAGGFLKGPLPVAIKKIEKILTDEKRSLQAAHESMQKFLNGAC